MSAEPQDPQPGAMAGAPPPATLRAVREQLSARLLAGDLDPAAFSLAYTEAADRFLERLFEHATKGNGRGYALLAVGGYGRRQLAPGSDLDLVLVHRGRRHFREVAKAIWYPLWDEGQRLDHSVRTRSEVLAVARDDLKVLLGLLDARVVAGDARVVERLLEDVLSLYRKDASRYLGRLARTVAARQEQAGELAFLLEPDLKQSAGGLRDAAALHVVRLALPDADFSEDALLVDRAEQLIFAARCALHCRTASGSDRLALQEQDQVAALLKFADADQLMGGLAEAGRTITAALEEGWHRARVGSSGGSVEAAGEIAVEPGIVMRDGEAALAADAEVRNDASLALRLARVAAERHLLIERASLERLAREAHRPSEPWSDAVRAAFVGLLMTGQSLVPAIEALDRRRLFELYLPEWRAVRNRPQRNAYHRFTVDRHLLEAVAATCANLAAVDRPDLLVLGALLHDLGKGFPGDHSAVGQEIAENVGRRIGLPASDCEVLGRIVAYHLVLPEFATRRDLDDPSTARVVASIVEDRQTLQLLAALAEADGSATGSAAWGPWKEELVGRLVARVSDVLEGRQLPAPAAPAVPAALAGAITERRLGIDVSGKHVTVVAPDRPGLLAAVTGVLALHGCNVMRASAGEVDDAMAVETYDVQYSFGEPPDWEKVEVELAEILAGRLPVEERLAEQERTYARGRRPKAAAEAPVRVHLDDTTSDLATIIEVRAPDRLGVLHRITTVLAEAGLDVVAALVDTLGHQVVDAFYVRDFDGGKLGLHPIEAERIRTLLHEVLTRA